MEVQIIPKSYSGKKEIEYEKGEKEGQNKQSPGFVGCKNEVFTVELFFDTTGAIENTPAGATIEGKMQELEKIVYRYNGDKHEPSYVIVVWGDLLFKGRLQSMDAEYLLFTPTGVPLRVKVKLEFIEYVSQEEAENEANNQSPDMSHLVMMRDGDTIAQMCKEIYGDSCLADEIARVNDLCGFRSVKPGTVLLFPHLKNHG